ncbi:hypothetical protein [Noviherbaspirillum pedocola]|uniref:Uncharacterized protein n=1 Tax=Noviherbaspirillum pedocola TaxID=2801341 RepID=A0A934SYY6_9BURK|nr:hypothetical protein [Noviherbaspirillum pedocola]MBK4735512.1 hypothetical protein [Noviherbaspirillum pedocola]
MLSTPPGDIRRLRLLLAHDARAATLTRPNPGLGAALANAHFILKPDIDVLEWHLRQQDHLSFLAQNFLNAACLAALACGLTERAVIHAMSNRLSKSCTPLRR